MRNLLPAVRPVAGGVFDGDVGGEVVFGGVFLRDGFGGVGDVEGDVETGEFALGFFGQYAGPFLGCDDVDDFYAVPVGVVVGAYSSGDEAVDCSLGAWIGVDAVVGLVLPEAACGVGFDDEFVDGGFGGGVWVPGH